MKDSFRHQGLRRQLIEELRSKGISDERVLAAMNRVPRHLFLDSSFESFAYQDKAFPIGSGQTISQPYTVAFQTEQLALEKEMKILEVGTGSGYLTRLLCSLSAHVVSVEMSSTLHQKATAKFKAQSIRNVTFVHADGLNGWETDAPYDCIVFTGSMPSLNQDIKQQLKLGGRLFVIIGRPPAMEAVMITRVSADEWSTVSLFETVVEPLTGADEPRAFTL